MFLATRSRMLIEPRYFLYSQCMPHKKEQLTESLIEQAVSKLFTNRTGIIIAHRLTTIQRADKIMVLEDGQIVEHGAREALATDPTSRLYQLLQTGLEEVRA